MNTNLSNEELLEMLETYKNRVEETERLLAMERLTTDKFRRFYNMLDILCKDYCNSEIMTKEEFRTYFYNTRIRCFK